MGWRWHTDENGKVGIYTTAAFHLIVLIILLLVTITTVVERETSFVLDFTRQEDLEKQEREIEIKESVTRELDDRFGKAEQKIRNTAVDAGSKLKDDRFKDPSKIYDEARDLQKKLDASKRDAIAQEKALEDAIAEGRRSDESETETQQKAYSGPSVISYRLDGRKAHSLPVPSYKGFGAGDVYVTIVVNRKGRVIAAKIQEENSTPDQQLWEFAVKAAKSSIFEASQSAGERQLGEIVYRFVKQ